MDKNSQAYNNLNNTLFLDDKLGYKSLKFKFPNEENISKNILVNML